MNENKQENNCLNCKRKKDCDEERRVECKTGELGIWENQPQPTPPPEQKQENGLKERVREVLRNIMGETELSNFQENLLLDQATSEIMKLFCNELQILIESHSHWTIVEAIQEYQKKLTEGGKVI